MRFEQLKLDYYDLPLSRPWIIPRTDNRKSFLLQLQPKLEPSSTKYDVSLGGWMQARLNDNVVLVNEMKLNYASQNDSSYIGREWRSISGTTNQSYLLWNRQIGKTGGMIFQAGRFYRQLGPGRHGQLLAGSNHRPIDQLSISLAKSFSKNAYIKFYFQTSALDKIGTDNRFMSLHRLEMKGGNWYFAVSEAMTYARKNQGQDAVYLNPFMIYHFEQLNGPGLSGNTIGTIDFGIKWKTSHLYSEILVDDVQFDNEVKGDLEPNELGGLVGYEFAGQNFYLSVEGVTITNRTYKTPDLAEWFVHRNEPIGYELGSDLGRVNVLTRYYLKENWHLDATIDMIWRGEGELSHPWDTPWMEEAVTLQDGYSEPFPTGVVEKSAILSVEVMRHWDRERWLGLGISYRDISNLNHVLNSDRSEFNLHLNASWSLEFEAIFDD